MLGKKELAYHLAHMLTETRMIKAALNEDGSNMDRLTHPEGVYKIVKECEEFLKKNK